MPINHMNHDELRALYEQYERINGRVTQARRETIYVDERLQLVRFRPNRPDSHGGWVIYSNLQEDEVAAAIASQIAYFTTLGMNFEWKLYDYDQPPDLKERLQQHGFQLEEVEAVLLLEIEQAPVLLQQAPASLHAAGLEIRRLTDAAQLADICAVEEAVWDEPFDWIVEELGLRWRQDPEEISLYCAYDSRTQAPISSAWITYTGNGPFAGLYGGSTLAAYRHQGLYTALLAARLQEARQRGRSILQVDASPMSRPILERFGFIRIAFSTPCNWQSSP